jgi:hypothetical protein
MEVGGEDPLQHTIERRHVVGQRGHRQGPHIVKADNIAGARTTFRSDKNL